MMQYDWRDTAAESDMGTVREVVGLCLSLRKDFNLTKTKADGMSLLSPTTLTHICRVIRKTHNIYHESVKIVNANIDNILVHESIKSNSQILYYLS